KAVGVKKGQFLSPEETKNILEKGAEVGNDKVFITERGSSFGYQNLVVDMRGFPIIRAMGAPVVYDITHSMQKPGGEGKQTGGTPQFARPLARAAAAAGADGFFMEVHDNPPAALSDRTTQIVPDHARKIIEDVLKMRESPPLHRDGNRLNRDFRFDPGRRAQRVGLVRRFPGELGLVAAE